MYWHEESAVKDYQQEPSGVGRSAYVFHRNGRPVNKTIFGKRWRRACVKAGLGHRVKDENGVLCYRGKHFHDFRRTAARNLIRAGVPQSIAHARHRPRDRRDVQPLRHH
jgi:integrase